MRQITDEDCLVRELNLHDLIAEFEWDVRELDAGDIDETEYQLITNQYAYVKFGLILEKIRKCSWWANCREKFADFRSFCQRKVNLNIWQAANAIKSAQVAVRLAFLGFTELPRNASQALKMSELSIERLGEVWGNIIAKHQGHKITASAIEDEIKPAVRNAIENVRIPVAVADKLRQQAIDRGLTLNEYLGQLANGEPDEVELIVTTPHDVDPELAAAVDVLDLKFARSSAIGPTQIIDRTVDSFDRIMTDLVGRFIPPVVRRVVNE
jgi:hypothetical protein